MKFYIKVLLLSLLPLLFSFGFGLYSVGQIVDGDKASEGRSYALEARIVAERLHALGQQLSMTANVLSRSADVAFAMRYGAVDTLYAWSHTLLLSGVSRIIIADMNGTVLTRAHNEYVFGDSIATVPAFAAALAQGNDMDTGVLDGRECLYFSKVIRQYDEIPVGVIIVAADITPALLQTLVEGSRAMVEYRSQTLAVLQSAPLENFAYNSSISLDSSADIYGGGVFCIYLPPNEGLRQLERYRDSLYNGFILAFVAVPLVMFFIIRYHFQSFGRLIAILVSFSDGRIVSGDMRDRLARIEDEGNEDVRKIASAICAMSAAMDESLDTLREKNQMLAALAQTDGLTGIANRMHMDSVLTQEMERAARYSTPLSIAMMDLDHFKSVNDDFGHVAGDTVLTMFAKMLASNSRDVDAVGRWGGEEFLVILTETGGDGALAWAERVREQCAEMDFGIPRAVTCSIGVSLFVPGMTLEEFVAAADAAMYRAKGQGRNRVVAQGVAPESD